MKSTKILIAFVLHLLFATCNTNSVFIDHNKISINGTRFILPEEPNVLNTFNQNVHCEYSGHTFEVQDMHVYLDDNYYGRVKRGDSVVIDADNRVYINDKLTRPVN